MRLTLRTLLAYLDDILEPNEAREIGKKVQAAPVAQELVTRIRDVVRRRRLKAPTLDGPESGLDPNIVSEYLDNQLTPPQVAQTERVLLNSEMHLAETASAHQILTLVLGEPVEVLPESRKRMYALGPVRQDEQLQVEQEETDEAVANNEPETIVAPAEHREAVATEATDTGVSLTEYLREGKSGWKVWPWVGIAALVCLFAFLQMTDPGKPVASATPVADGNGDAADAAGGTDEAINTNDAGPGGEVVAQAEKGSDEQPALPTATEPKTGSDEPAVVAADANALPNPSVTNNGIDGAPRPDEPETAMATPDATDTTPGDTADVKVVGIEAIDQPKVMNLEPPTKPDDGSESPPAPSAPVADNGGMVPPPVAADPPKTSVTRMQFVSESAVLLREMGDEGWKIVKKDEAIADGDRIASPRPYVSQFAAADLPVQLHLGAGSRLQLFRSTTASFGVRMELGHIVISRKKPEGDDANTEPANIEILVADKSWTVTIPAAESRMAFDVTPVPPVRLDTNYDGFPYKVWAVGSRGSVQVKPTEGDAKDVGSEDRIALAGPTPGQVLVEPGAESDWLVGKDPVEKWIQGPTAPTDKRDAIKFRAEFDPTDPISATMPALIKHERAFMSRRAVQCLALTDDYRAMVRTLSIGEHDEALAEAIQGLRAWLPSHPENGTMLKEALETEFTSDDTESIYKLLWGFDEQHARDAKTSRELVRWLGHPRRSVQRLAYFHILRLTGSQDEYRTSLSQDRLSSFRKRWERQIEKYDTLLRQ